MAFCKQCGADLNGANFCASCGTPADGNVVVQQAAPAMDPRQQTLVEMNRMQVYFGAKAEDYRNYDAVAAEVKERSEKTFTGWIVLSVICLLIGLFSKAAYFYIAIVPFVALYILQKKKNKEKLAIVSAEMEKLGSELTQFYADYGYCPVGQEYTHPDVLPVLCEYVNKGRANTLSDAINRMIEDEERAKAEADRKMLIEQNKEIAKEAKKARRYAAADFWLKR